VTKQGKILIADDDNLFLQTTAAVLEKAGHMCSCVANAAAAVELTTRDQFDLLIADVNMPGNSRLELIQSLQVASFYLPVILVTGQPSLPIAVQSIQLQIVAYLIKPFDVPQLLTEVQRALVRVDTQRRMLGLQSRWRTWGEDLIADAEAIQPVPGASRQALEAMLNVSLRNLAQCIADVQEIRQVLSPGEQSPCSKDVSSFTTQETSTALVPREKIRTDQLSSLKVIFERASLPADLRGELRQLSRREREVLRLLLANHKPQTIATSLFISLHTVRNHLRSIFEKLDVHSQTELLTRFGRYETGEDLHESA
jgi:DNA-binding NarL/FixJ family response regulator